MQHSRVVIFLPMCLSITASKASLASATLVNCTMVHADVTSTRRIPNRWRYRTPSTPRESGHDGTLHADSITVTGSVGRARERLVLPACLPIRPFRNTGHRKRKIDSPAEWDNGFVDPNGGRAATPLDDCCIRRDS